MISNVKQIWQLEKLQLVAGIYKENNYLMHSLIGKFLQVGFEILLVTISEAGEFSYAYYPEYTKIMCYQARRALSSDNYYSIHT